MAEPSAAQLDAGWGARGRRQSCCAEQKPEPAGEKGPGVEVDRTTSSKVKFSPRLPERTWAAFSEQVTGRATKAAGG